MGKFLTFLTKLNWTVVDISGKKDTVASYQSARKIL